MFQNIISHADGLGVGYHAQMFCTVWNQQLKQQQQLWQSTMASTKDTELEHLLIAAGITENSRKLIARDFIDCEGLEDVLVRFVR